ncbi:gliding motility protein RemB [Flavobacteriales bacterium]|nr:gliding motility protein RemB [Flavobacteriales bacterium]
MKKYVLFFVLSQLTLLMIGQTNAPLSHSYYSYLEKDMHDIGVSNHTSFKPFLYSTDDTIFYNSFKPIVSKKSIIHNFFNSNLLSIKHTDYSFELNPLFHFEIAEDNDRRYINTRGIEVKGRVGEKLSFYSSFYENQMVLPDYLEDYVKNNENVVPGQGMVKYNLLYQDSFLDFYYANGYINYDINKFFDVQLGHGKHFIGDGYRSMMLSDNSFNYPYFKITTDVWKFKYVNLFSYFQDINFDIDKQNISKSKFSAIHYLSTYIGERLNIGFFESIISGEDSIGNVFDINYMNPIIFYRPVEYSIGYSRQGNSLLGVSFKYKLTSSSHVYGQLVLDEFRLEDFRAKNGAWRNKYGGQLGMKYFDAFEFENLTLQTELNFARPYTYSHFNPIQNYAHYAQPLAHPLGTSFLENVSFIRYRKDRWTADLKLLQAKYGGEIAGDNTNYGSDIFLSYDENFKEFGNDIAQGNTSNLQIIDFRAGYIVNPNTNLKIELGITNRLLSNRNTTAENQYLFFSLKTDLQNFYYDF